MLKQELIARIVFYEMSQSLIELLLIILHRNLRSFPWRSRGRRSPRQRILEADLLTVVLLVQAFTSTC